ncbi:hypothetical protein BABINDRAFT_163120 [Babjeviella inositovora NRRL Y-12698]|uniref:Uncharacterized protein n=1 Tax=Babjeviella inositovora NRRL Y-12698 TaxID=984486 RepID=A0A1E3QM81_9ASCO|nr:uncharacterized protein BABINDRAFT_163120 [Babjeviella inositovora NRRL Y-12698]ODQ78097.1 hypothetical protein BABINDRAFT_163120 [Babjeviella inositovora NRRL Y-12698]
MAPAPENGLPTSKNLSRIGANDSTITDSISRQTYAWRSLPPAVVPHWNKGERKGSTFPIKIPTLKTLASRKIAGKVLHVQPEHLAAAPQWSIWRAVWENILLLHNDSPAVFNLFANFFHTEPTFRSHFMTSSPTFYYTASPTIEEEAVQHIKQSRNLKLINTCLPGIQGAKHRLEVFFRNVNISNDLSLYLNRLTYGPFVVLNLAPCSAVFAAREDILSLLKIDNLAALDLSSFPQLDDNLLYSLGLGLKNGKWPELRVLRLSSRKGGAVQITSAGLSRFLFDVSRIPMSKLCCVETNVAVTEVPRAGSGWELTSDPVISKLPMALKLFFLHNQSNPANTESHSPPRNFIHDLYSRIVLDVTVQDEDYPTDTQNVSPRDVCHQMEKLWSKPSTTTLLSYCYTFSAENATAAVEKVKATPARGSKPVLKVRRTGNAKSFFDL